MKYTGRFISILIVAISSLGLILYNYISHIDLHSVHIIVSAFYLFIGWRLGKQYDKVKYLSEKDLLTGSYNRRFVMDTFPKLKSLSDKKVQKIIIFLIDVDDFKSINDQYGHAMGDRVLQLISSTLNKVFRDSDDIVRWGGDEFLCIVPRTDESGMNELQIRLHNELNRLSTMVAADVSVSVGYATYPDEGIGLNELIKIADRKMYNDKRSKNSDKAIFGRIING
jgi:diguanylate cyclase (GGDEF)-like protein